MGCASSSLLKQIEADVLPVKRHLRSSYAHKGQDQGLASSGDCCCAAGTTAATPGGRAPLRDVLLLHSPTGAAWVAGFKEVLVTQHQLSVGGPMDQQRSSAPFGRMSSTGQGEILPVKEGPRLVSGTDAAVVTPAQLAAAVTQAALGVVVLVSAGSTWDEALLSCLRHQALRQKPLVLLHIPESCPAPNPSDWPVDIQQALLLRSTPMLTFISTYAAYGAQRVVAELQRQQQQRQQQHQAGQAGPTATAAAAPTGRPVVAGTGGAPAAAQAVQAGPHGAAGAAGKAAAAQHVPHTISLSLDSKESSGEMVTGSSSAGTLTGTSTDSRLASSSLNNMESTANGSGSSSDAGPPYGRRSGSSHYAAPSPSKAAAPAAASAAAASQVTHSQQGQQPSSASPQAPQQQQQQVLQVVNPWERMQAQLVQRQQQQQVAGQSPPGSQLAVSEPGQGRGAAAAGMASWAGAGPALQTVRSSRMPSLASAQSADGGRTRADVVLAVHHPKFYHVAMHAAHALSPYFSVVVVDGSLSTSTGGAAPTAYRPMRHTLHSLLHAGDSPTRLLGMLPQITSLCRTQPVMSENGGEGSPFAINALSCLAMPGSARAAPLAPPLPAGLLAAARPASPAAMTSIHEWHATDGLAAAGAGALGPEDVKVSLTAHTAQVHGQGSALPEHQQVLPAQPTTGAPAVDAAAVQPMGGRALAAGGNFAHHVRSVSVGATPWPLQLKLHTSRMAPGPAGSVSGAGSLPEADLLPFRLLAGGSPEAADAVSHCRHYVTCVGYHLGTASATAPREAVQAMQGGAMLHVVCEASFNMLSPDANAWACTEAQALLVRGAWSRRLLYAADHVDPFLAELAARLLVEPGPAEQLASSTSLAPSAHSIPQPLPPSLSEGAPPGLLPTRQASSPPGSIMVNGVTDGAVGPGGPAAQGTAAGAKSVPGLKASKSAGVPISVCTAAAGAAAKASPCAAQHAISAHSAAASHAPCSKSKLQSTCSQPMAPCRQPA